MHRWKRIGINRLEQTAAICSLLGIITAVPGEHVDTVDTAD